MAAIFSVEKQYSKLPKAFTLLAFRPISRVEKEMIQTHSGIPVNQYFMYMATAVTSVPTARTMAAQ